MMIIVFIIVFILVNLNIIIVIILSFLQFVSIVAKEWVSDIKFSSNDRILAVGAHDCKP